MKQRMIRLSVWLMLPLMVVACTRTVTRIDPNTTVDLSGRWNDTDSKLVAAEMTKDVLARPWRANFAAAQRREPVIIVGMIVNKTTEYIDADVFIKDIERELINSGMVRIVQNSEFREKLRQERADQQEFASLETQKKWGKEMGADYMMFGNISSIIDQYNKKKTVFYKVNLELTDMETNEIVWIGDKEIKKYIKN